MKNGVIFLKLSDQGRLFSPSVLDVLKQRVAIEG